MKMVTSFENLVNVIKVEELIVSSTNCDPISKCANLKLIKIKYNPWRKLLSFYFQFLYTKHTCRNDKFIPVVCRVELFFHQLSKLLISSNVIIKRLKLTLEHTQIDSFVNKLNSSLLYCKQNSKAKTNS